MRISDWSSDVCSSDLFDLRQHLVGEARRHHERRVTRRAAQIHQTTLCQHDDLLAVRKFDQVGARLDLGPLVIGQRRDLDLAVEMADRSEEHTSELQSLMRISYAVFCLKQKKDQQSESSEHHS